MRSLLELHYDEVHTADWVRTHATKRVPARESEYKIFHKVAQLQRQRPNQQLSLPASVKNILRKPSDELQWARLEMLRSVVQQELEGERDFVLNQEEIQQLARSIAACRSKQFPDEVAAGSVVPEGSRVCLGQDVVAPRVTARRRHVASVVRGMSDRVRVKTRPRGTSRAPSMDVFSRSLFADEKSLEQLAQEQGLSIEETLDRLLLSLWDALFLTQCEGWTADNVANLSI